MMLGRENCEEGGSSIQQPREGTRFHEVDMLVRHGQCAASHRRVRLWCEMKMKSG